MPCDPSASSAASPASWAPRRTSFDLRFTAFLDEDEIARIVAAARLGEVRIQVRSGSHPDSTLLRVFCSRIESHGYLEPGVYVLGLPGPRRSV
jgi:hypothetical protein